MCNPRWWNGIHDGLKIRWRKPYEFESRLGDLNKNLKVKNDSKTQS